ncbi:AN1-type zinc finger protein 4 [Grammomys surdaster]|uniref:AN1-type zinc finger protein 4 n=1 Tax=Grammomys surdaster TaxID=491861 RepID=UPI0010A05B7B|nr:AN1-type zinc finger protein 4 [Grammomys surdaster]
MFKADLGRIGIQLHTTYSRRIRKVKVMDNRKEPPFFNEDNVGPFYFKLPFYDTMELFIETLTGTCFELRVSPFEAIISVKGKIQRLEGIPICQQHLIWNNMELEDDYCLNDYNISEGCTLKLVLAMRGGPISTRKVPVEDPLRELAEYMDSSRDEAWERTSCNKQVTFLVYREGDQLNFFRVVDRGDGTLTPLSESLRIRAGLCEVTLNEEEHFAKQTKEGKLLQASCRDFTHCVSSSRQLQTADYQACIWNINLSPFGFLLGENIHHLPPVKAPLQTKKKITKHCFLCGKKTGLATSFECRCGNNFCASHRYAEAHGCTYDYKSAGRRYLQEANPVVNAPKLPKI